MEQHILFWIIFGVVVILLLILDLGVFHKKSHVISVREAIIWTAVWISLSLSFGAGIYVFEGKEEGLKFLTGYLLEQSLSVDNIFVFYLLFSFYRLAPQYQHKVLYWGVLGAIVFRGLFIVAGIAVIEKFHWVIYILSVFLAYAGLNMLATRNEEVNPEKSWFIRFIKKIIPVSGRYYEDRFFVKINGKKTATLLLIVLITIEFTDIIFAVDSVPAIIAITKDPFIVFTSNIFAIMGLRSLYFAVSGAANTFRYLKYGLSCILVMIGIKMFLHEIYEVPTLFSLLVIASILFMSIAVSVFWSRLQKKPSAPNLQT